MEKKMTAKKIIFYLGKQEKFLSYFNSYKEKNPSFEHRLKQIKCLTLDDFALVSNDILKYKVDILIIESFLLSKNALTVINLLKSHSALKDMKFVLSFVDKEEQLRHEQFYSSGLDYSFLVTEEIELVFKDIMHLAADSSVEQEQFATVSEISIPISAHFFGHISSLSEKRLLLETSLPVKEEEELNLSLIDTLEKPLNTVVVKKESSFAPRSYFNFGIECSSLEEAESVLNFKTDLFETVIQSNTSFLLFDNRLEIFEPLASYLSETESYVRWADKLIVCEDFITSRKPQVILYQMEVEPADLNAGELLNYNGATTFEALIRIVKAISDYKPYILVFNERSRSQAYRKVFDYKNIVVNRKPFEIGHLEMVVESYSRQRGEGGDYVPKSKENQFVSLESTIKIHSLSEKYLTFSCEKTLQTFVTFKLKTPTFTVLVTVIPSFEGDPVNTYTGLVSSASETEKQEVRRLVNMLLELELSPTEEFLFKSADQLQDDVIQEKKNELKLLRKEREEEFLKNKEDERKDDFR